MRQAGFDLPINPLRPLSETEMVLSPAQAEVLAQGLRKDKACTCVLCQTLKRLERLLSPSTQSHLHSCSLAAPARRPPWVLLYLALAAGIVLGCSALWLLVLVPL